MEVVYDSQDFVKAVRDITTRPVEPEPKPSDVATSISNAQPGEVNDENSSEAQKRKAPEP